MVSASPLSKRTAEVVGTGFTALDRIYSADRLAIETLGGSCGNVMISLSMLGRKVAPVLELGDDITAVRLINEFTRAGADVTHIGRQSDAGTPIVEQRTDPDTGQHYFSFAFGPRDGTRTRYVPATRKALAVAHRTVAGCDVFYADRTNADILRTMRLAKANGAVVVFEPSDFLDRAAISEACVVADIVKVSSDRLPPDVLLGEAVQVVTYGARGLKLLNKGTSTWLPAKLAPRFEDACGSGDMVTVGLIEALLSSRRLEDGSTCIDAIARGLAAGQRMAAANCAYAGARGMFREKGTQYVRTLMD